MPELSLYTTQVPAFLDASDGYAERVLGTVFKSSVDTFIVGARWVCSLTRPTHASLGLWSLTGDNPAASTGTRIKLAVADPAGLVLGTWNRLDFTAPIPLPANIPRLIQVNCQNYTYRDGDWPLSNGTLSAYLPAEGGNGRWQNGVGENTPANYPGGGATGYNFYVDIITYVSPASSRYSGADFLSFF